MPQAAQGHGRHQIDVLAGPAFAVAAQGNVEIVAQPQGKGDVPTPPEVPQAERNIRGVEVVRDVEAEEQGQPLGQVGIARKIAIDLHGVGQDAHQHRRRGEPLRRAEGAAHDMLGQVARNDDFLNESPGDEIKGPGEIRAGHPLLFELRQEIPGPQDGAGQDGREKGDVAEHFHQAAFDLGGVAIDVDGVGHALKGEKGDAYRHDDVEQGHRALGVEHPVEPIERDVEHLVIFEENQHPQRKDTIEDEAKPSEAGLRGLGENHGEKPGQKAEDQQDQQKLGVERGVKDIGGKEQKDPVQAGPGRKSQLSGKTAAKKSANSKLVIFIAALPTSGNCVGTLASPSAKGNRQPEPARQEYDASVVSYP